MRGWGVNDKFQFSDHRRIECEVMAGVEGRRSKWQLAGADWVVFSDRLKRSDWVRPRLWSSGVLDREVKHMDGEISTALDAACGPRSYHCRPKRRTVLWWSEELSKLKSQARRAERV